MKEQIVFCTHCTDDAYEASGCPLLETSFRRFHPNTPWKTFHSRDLSWLPDPWDLCHVIAQIGLVLSERYERVVHLDADSLVVGSLDELYDANAAWEVAGALDNWQGGPQIASFADVDVARYGEGCALLREEGLADLHGMHYLNAGLVAVNGRSFWEEWHELNRRHSQICHFEQGVFNVLFNRRLHTAIMEHLHPSVLYGAISYCGSDDWRERRSLQKTELRDGKLYLAGRQLKVIHQAGHPMPKARLDELLSGEALAFVRKLTHKEWWATW